MKRTTELLRGAQPNIPTVDNGGTRTRVALGGARIDNILTHNTPRNYNTAIDTIAEKVHLLMGGRKPDAIGFSVAGAVDKGVITQAGELQKFGWVGKPFAEDVAAATGVPVENVVLLNDCAAGANAERLARIGDINAPVDGRLVPQRPDVELLELKPGEHGMFMVDSTGVGGALYTARQIDGDEPGHEFLKPGAICGDGQDGHFEAHVGGAGILNKYGERGENIPHDDLRWVEIKGDLHDGIAQMLDRHQRGGRNVRMIGFTGAVALGGPDMLGGLQRDLNNSQGDRAPRIVEAAYGEESGLYGAYYAADEVLRVGDAAVVYQR